MLSLALQLCSYGEGSSTGSANVSVSSTAFATVRQLIALVMDSTSEVLASTTSNNNNNNMPNNNSMPNNNNNSNNNNNTNNTPTISNSLRSSSAQENLPRCAILLIKDLSRFIRGQTGEWMRG